MTQVIGAGNVPDTFMWNLFSGNVNLGSGNLKVALASNTAVPEFYDGVGEVFGVGYTAGGEALSHTFNPVTGRIYPNADVVWPLLGPLNDDIATAILYEVDSLVILCSWQCNPNINPVGEEFRMDMDKYTYGYTFRT